MYITIQYPLFDGRLLSGNPNRIDRPNLLDPQSRDILRYIGEVIDPYAPKTTGENNSQKIGQKNYKRYRGTWDSDKKYFDASSVLVLAGLEKRNYLQKLRNTAFKTKLLFRRFQTDARFLARFEMAWTDEIENTVDFANFDDYVKAWKDHIRQYLECAIKIKIGKRHRGDLSIGQAGNQLMYTYYWATMNGKSKSFADKDLQYRVEYLSPALIIHTKESPILRALGFEEIKIPGLEIDQLHLYYGQIGYEDDTGPHSIAVWMMGSSNPDHYLLHSNRQFQNLPDSIKSLRNNLLQLPCQLQTIKKINSYLENPSNQCQFFDGQVQMNVSKYLHSCYTSMIKDKRNNQDQRRILDVVCRNLGTTIKSEYQKTLDWIGFLTPTPAIENMKAQLTGLQFKKKVYISSTFKDLKDYRKILKELFEKELHTKLELSYIMELMYDDGSHSLFTDDCIRAVKDSDIYFMILGNKVGSYPPNEKRTYTEIEYDTAVQYDKKMHLLKLKKFNEAEIDDKIKHEEILNKFAGRPQHEFEGLDDFKLKVLEILVQY